MNVLFEFLQLSRKHEYSSQEIFLCELLNRQSMAEKQRTGVSKVGLLRLQQQLNPESASPMVEDKAIFYSLCRERGLPSAGLLAIWGPDSGWAADGSPLESDAAWTVFLESLQDPEIVIKPSFGVYGHGIRFLRRVEGGWEGHNGAPRSTAEILDDLRRDVRFDRFVIQPRVRPHARMVELSGTSALQTLRIVTGVTGDADVQIHCADQKIISGDAQISNFFWGTTGNAIGDIDLETGIIVESLAARSDGVGMDPMDKHPVTGQTLKGFRVPYWADACDLCKRAAMEFLPLRTIGWDVAITDHGPVLIEGNAWWDPHTETRRMGPFLTFAGDALQRPFTPPPARETPPEITQPDAPVGVSEEVGEIKESLNNTNSAS